MKNDDATIFEFTPYLFGPYSNEVINDLNFLKDLEFVKEQETNIPISNAESVEQKKDSLEDEQDDLWDEVTINSLEPLCEENFEKEYLLTEKGISFVKEKLWNKLGENQASVLLRLKTQINRIPLDDLLNYVYHKYPEYTVNSTIRDKYF